MLTEVTTPTALPASRAFSATDLSATVRVESIPSIPLAVLQPVDKAVPAAEESVTPLLSEYVWQIAVCGN